MGFTALKDCEICTHQEFYVFPKEAFYNNDKQFTHAYVLETCMQENIEVKHGAPLPSGGQAV